MKIAIIGDTSRADAWEKHLRKLAAIHEVVITSSLENKNEVDAALLLDDGTKNLSSLEHLIKLGLHTYFISQLPSDSSELERMYRLASESNVRVQFSHWPTLAPASMWMIQQMKKPDLIQIKREVQMTPNSTAQSNIDHHWIDELGWATKILGGNVHRVEAKQLSVEKKRVGISINLRYEDASVAAIQFSALGNQNIHQRTISDGTISIDCDAIRQHVKLFRENSYGNIKSETHNFDPKLTAENSIFQFVKSIQLKKETLFNPYDAYQTALVTEKILKQLDKN